jgi:hypothetical protein
LQHSDKQLYLGGFAGTLNAFKGNEHGPFSMRRLLSLLSDSQSSVSPVLAKGKTRNPNIEIRHEVKLALNKSEISMFKSPKHSKNLVTGDSLGHQNVFVIWILVIWYCFEIRASIFVLPFGEDVSVGSS